jgi:hypothetical protein
LKERHALLSNRHIETSLTNARKYGSSMTCKITASAGKATVRWPDGITPTRADVPPDFMSDCQEPQT